MATGGISDIDRGTDETFDFLCSMCQGKNKNTEGEHFCADCSDYYCSSHVKIHDEVPALKNHKILNKAQFKSSSSVHFPAVPTERCRVHGHKPVDMFCQQHDSVGCATCMVVKHSNCKEKFYVPDYIKNNTTSVSPNNITVQLDAIANTVAELQKEFIKEKEDLRSSKEKSLKQIQNWRNEINGLLDELENKTVQALEQRFQSLIDKIETALRELQASTTDIQSAQDSLKSARSNMAQMFVSIKMASEVASLTQEKVSTTQTQDSSTKISFVPHLKLQSVLKEMQALGDISITENLRSKSVAPSSLQHITKTQTSSTFSESPATTATTLPVTLTQTSFTFSKSPATTATTLPVTLTQTSFTFSKSPATTATTLPVTLTQTSFTFSKSPARTATTLPVTMTQTSSTFSKSPATTATTIPGTMTQTRQQSFESRPKPSLLQVKGKKTYTVKMKSDNSTCGIVSACTLADGTIILADYNNSKLKCINRTSYTITDYCDVPDRPRQVCAISDQDVAIACGSSLIQFVSIGWTMQMTDQINTGFECRALAYADGKLFVSDNKSVYVYSVSGDKLQQFSQDQSGQQIFSNIRSLAVSSDHSKIYVADFNKGLIILDRTGQIVGQFNGPELEGACSVYLYKNDNVLVSGFDSENVLQFSPDCKLLGEVLTTEGGCKAVCCNKDNTKLIVGLLTEDEIEVYDII